MDSAEYFVFMRYWMGFGPKYPLYDRGHLPDGELINELTRHLLQTLKSQRSRIVAERRVRQRRVLRAKQRQRDIEIAELNHKPKPTQVRRSKERKFFDLLSAAGLGGSSGPLETLDGRRYIVSPRIWLSRVPNKDLAVALVKSLTTDPPALDTESLANIATLNPRLGYVGVAEAGGGVDGEIGRLRAGGTVFSSVTTPYLRQCDAFLGHGQQASHTQVNTPDDHRSPEQAKITKPETKLTSAVDLELTPTTVITSPSRATISERMQEAVINDRTRAEWTSKQWSDFLGCSDSRVRTKNSAWDELRRLAKARQR